MATVADINTLSESAKCFRCLSRWQRLQIQTYVMAYAAGLTDPNEVSDGARCLDCLSNLQLQQLKLHLLTVIDTTIPQDANELMEDFACYVHCPSQELLSSIETYLLVNDPSGPGITDPGLIAEAAACFGCVSEHQTLAMQVYSLIVLTGQDPNDPGIIGGLIDDSTWTGEIPGGPGGPIIGITTGTTVVVEDDGGIGGGGTPCVDVYADLTPVITGTYTAGVLTAVDILFPKVCCDPLGWSLYESDSADMSGGTLLVNGVDTVGHDGEANYTINVDLTGTPPTKTYVAAFQECVGPIASQDSNTLFAEGGPCGYATASIQITGAGTAEANGYYVTTDGVTYTNILNDYFILFLGGTGGLEGALYTDLAVELYTLDDAECFPCGAWTTTGGTGPAPIGAWISDLDPGLVASDTMETYSNLDPVNGLNGGTGFNGAYVARDAFASMQAFDTMETYSNLDPLNGLNGGSGFAGAYVAKTE